MMGNQCYISIGAVNRVMRGGAHLSIACLVCGESVALEEWEERRLDYGLSIHSKICDKCKTAILYMRDQMEQKEN